MFRGFVEARTFRLFCAVEGTPEAANPLPPMPSMIAYFDHEGAVIRDLMDVQKLTFFEPFVRFKRANSAMF